MRFSINGQHHLTDMMADRSQPAVIRRGNAADQLDRGTGIRHKAVLLVRSDVD